MRSAVYTHVRVSDYNFQFGLANGFLALAVATLTLNLAMRPTCPGRDRQRQPDACANSRMS